MRDINTSQSSGKKRILILLGCLVLMAALWGGNELLRWRAKQVEQKFFTAAVEAREVEDWELLKKISERWVSVNAESGTAWLALADSCQNLGELESAQSALAQLDSSDPHFLEAQALRGDLLYLDLKRPFDAEANWRAMIEIAPSSKEAYQGLISVYAFTVQRLKMIETIRDAITQKCEPPEAYVYLILSDRLSFGRGRFRVDEWLQKNPDNEILEVARAYYRARHNDSSHPIAQESNSLYQGDWSEMNALVSKYPENLNVLAFQIENALIDGRVTVAIELLNQLPAEAEDDFRFWRYRARALLESGDAEQAINSAQIAVRLNPYDWRSRLILGEAFRVLQKPEDAKRQAELGDTGKDMERKLLSLENPVDFWELNLIPIYKYIQELGDYQVAEALRNNTGFATESP